MASDFASIFSHIHNWALFLLWFQLFILSEVISPLISHNWAPTDLGSSSFHLFTLFMWFSRQEYWSGLPFPSSVGHILLVLSTMTHPSWVALHGMVYSFIELDKTVVHVISLVSFLWFDFHSVCPLMDKDKRLMEAPWWERLMGKLDLVLRGRAMLSKSWIQLPADGWGCVPSLLFDPRPNYGGGNEDNRDLLQQVSHRPKSVPPTLQHRTGKGQLSFQSQRKAMPKNAQTTTQLQSSHMLVK